jgi:hypothetical protein
MAQIEGRQDPRKIRIEGPLVIRGSARIPAGVTRAAEGLRREPEGLT